MADTMADDTPRRKRARTGARYQIELNFLTNEDKKIFINRMDRAKKKLSGSSWPLDNRELLTALLDLLEDGSDDGDVTVHQTNKDRFVKPMLDCSGGS